METIIKRYVKQFGYTPTLLELKNLYTMGLMRLSDNEENILIKEFEKLNNYEKNRSDKYMGVR